MSAPHTPIPTNPSATSTPPRSLTKKNTVLLLRTVVVISTGYLIVFGDRGRDPGSLAYIAALFVSNLALGFVPDSRFHSARFSAILLLSDTAAVLLGLYLTVGCFSQDFLIIYFFTIFLTTAAEGVAQIAIGAALVSSLYGYWLYLSATHALAAGDWLRLPFFFIVAVFYAYMTEEAKVERWQRQQAERERERLRFLLALSERQPDPRSRYAWISEVAAVVESAFPRLACKVSTQPLPEDVGEAAWFAIRGGDADELGLLVLSRDERALTVAEEQFCKVLVSVAGRLLVEAAVASDGESHRIRQEFFGLLSHELRTPLHAILGYAEMLEVVLGPTADPRAAGMLERVRANACHLEKLIDNTLALAELRAGERAVEVEDVSLAQVLSEACISAHQKISGRPIELSAEVAPGVPRLFTDKRKLEQIIACLVDNAVKFTDRGFIRLEAVSGGAEHIEIRVSDSGGGIADEHLHGIFEAFRQGDASPTRTAAGMGVGLALVRELVILLGGNVEVDTRLGNGAVFRVLLPARPPQASPSTATAAVVPALGLPALAS